MKISKRVLCIILAVAVMVGTFGLMSALAENESSTSYLYDYDSGLNASDSGLNASFITGTKMNELLGQKDSPSKDYAAEDTTAGASKKYNENKSATLAITGEQYSANLEIPVTDDMRNIYKDNHELKASLYLSKSLTKDNKFTSSIVRIYLKFKNSFTKYKEDTGAKELENVYLYPIYNASLNAYQQEKEKTIKFKKYGFNTTTKKAEPVELENLDEVDSIIVSLYNYTAGSVAELQISGFAYEGTPEVNAFPEVEPESAETNVSFTDWEKDYYRDGWGDAPSAAKWYKDEDGTYDSSKYSSKKNIPGYMYWKSQDVIESKQIAYVSDLNMDAYNKAIATANQEGGSKQGKITFYLKTVEDEDEASMPVEFQLQFSKYGGGAYTPIQQFVEPGKVKTLTFDTSELDINQISAIRVAIMAFWKYSPKKKLFYDTNTMIRKDKNGKELKAYKNEETGDIEYYSADEGKTKIKPADIDKNTKSYWAMRSSDRKIVDITSIKDGLKDRKMNKVEAFFSPVYTVKKSEKVEDKTIKTTTTTTAKNSTEYKYSGYHFYDFTEEALNGYYGLYTHPSFINFLYEKYYLQNEIVDKNLKKDGQAQGFKDNLETGKKVTNNAEYNKLYQEAKDMKSGGYQVELKSPYPRIQCQHQSAFFMSGKREDAERVKDNENHKPLKVQNEKYDFSTQMKNGLKYAKEHTNPEKRGYLAIDVYAISSVHGYKNTYNSTYKSWCKKHKKKCQNENARLQVQVGINAHNEEDGDKASVKVAQFVNVGEKKTLYLDVSELEFNDITGVVLQPQSYENLANKQQGGDDKLVGVTDVQVRFSAIYVPSDTDAGLTTTRNVTEPPDEEDIKKIGKLYNALPSHTKVDPYLESYENFEQLEEFFKVWTNASLETQKECEKRFGIDASTLSMIEQEAYEYWMNNNNNSDDNSDDDYSPGTGDIAFPMMALIVLGVSGYLIVRTRKSKKEN